MGFADNVRANRERLGLSQEELARRVGLTNSADMDRKLTAQLGGEMYAEPYDESGLAGHIELLTASYSPTGELAGLYRRRDGRLWSPCEWAHTPTIDATTDLR